MAEGGRKAKKRATATKRKKSVPQGGSGKPKSTKPKSTKTKSIKLKPGSSKASNFGSETARLKSELRAARDRQAASAEVMRLISTSPGDADQALRRIAEIAERLFGASSVSLLIADGERWGRTIRVGAGSERIATAIPEAHVAITSQFMPGAVYLENRQVNVSADDPAAVARWPGLTPARAVGTRTISGTPLRSEGRAIGALIVHRDRPVPFTEDDLALLQSFADQAVIATENARLFNQTREALERQTATADILKVIASSPSDVQPVFEAIAASSNRLIGGFSTAVLRFVGDELHLAAFTPANPKADEVLKSSFPRPLSEFPLFMLVRDGETQQFADTESQDVPPLLRDLARLRGYRSMLFTPLMNNGKPIGIISVTRKAPGTFAAHHVQLVRTFADQAVIAVENVRLFDEVQAKTADLSESLQQQTVIGDVLKTISRSTFDLQPVLEALVESAARLCDAEMAYIMRREGDVYRGGAAVGFSEEYVEFLSQQPLAVDRGTITGRAAMERHAVQILDVATDPEYKLAESTSLGRQHTALGVPLLREDEPIGVVVLARRRVQAFTPKQIELVTTFADQAVIAIENVRLFDEVRRRTDDLSEALQQQTATADVLKVISRSAFDLQAVFDTLISSAVELSGALSGTICLRNGDGYRYFATSGLSDDFRKFLADHPPTPSAGSAAGRVILTGDVVSIPDLLEDPDYVVPALALTKTRSLLGVPLLRNDRVEGALVLARTEPGLFTDRQIEIVKTFADQAVIAVENVRLFEEVQARTEDLRESLQQQTATADVLKVISRSAFDLKSVLTTLTESAQSLCGASLGIICLRDGEVMRLQAESGCTQAFIAFMQANPIRPGRETITGRVFMDGKSVHVADVQLDPEYNFGQAPTIGAYRSVLAVPLMRDGAVEGVLLLGRPEPGTFSQRQIDLVQTFADQAVIAIENVRLFEQVRERTKELSLSLEELRTAQDRLVQTEKLASLGQLTAGIAHEIKNPLNFVNNFSSLSAELIDELNDALKPAALDDKVREEINELTRMLKGNLEKVVQHGKRADSIVKNMLLHSREGSGEHRLADINAIVEESLNLAYHGARAERSGFNITLQRDLDPAAGMIDLYPQEITRVFLNLISNGFYATAKRKAAGGEGFEPTLRATTKDLGNEVEIRIRDNGTGIPLDVREKMFNPFFTTKPAGEGTGLGLSMSHDIVVKQHGGKIDVDTIPGAFTEFIITLPRTAAQLQAGGTN